MKIAECCGISREHLLKENGILDYLHDRFGTILFYRKVVELCLRVIVNANIIMGPLSELFVQVFGAKKGELKTAERIRASREISQRLMVNLCKQGNGDSHEKKKKMVLTTILSTSCQLCSTTTIMWPRNPVTSLSYISQFCLFHLLNTLLSVNFQPQQSSCPRNGSWMKPSG